MENPELQNLNNESLPEIQSLQKELQQLSNTESLSTQEEEIRNYFLSKAEGFGIKTEVDVRGNL